MPINSRREDSAQSEGQSQQAGRPIQKNMLGIGAENFDSVFLLHRHDGSAMGGGNLYGPYFIRDSNGKVYKIVVSTLGVLSTVAV